MGFYERLLGYSHDKHKPPGNVVGGCMASYPFLGEEQANSNIVMLDRHGFQRDLGASACITGGDPLPDVLTVFDNAYRRLFGNNYHEKITQAVVYLAYTADGYGHSIYTALERLFLNKFFSRRVISANVVDVAGHEDSASYHTASTVYEMIQHNRDPQTFLVEKSKGASLPIKLVYYVAGMLLKRSGNLSGVNSEAELTDYRKVAKTSNDVGRIMMQMYRLVQPVFSILAESPLFLNNMHLVCCLFDKEPDVIIASHASLARAAALNNYRGTIVAVISDAGFIKRNLFPFATTTGKTDKLYYVVASDTVAESLINGWGVKKEKIFICGAPATVENHLQLREKLDDSSKRQILLPVSGNGCGLTESINALVELAADPDGFNDMVINIFTGHFKSSFSDSGGTTVAELQATITRLAPILATKGIELVWHHANSFSEAAAMKLELARKAHVMFDKPGEMPMINQNFATALLLWAVSSAHEWLNLLYGEEQGTSIFAPWQFAINGLADRWKARVPLPNDVKVPMTFPQTLRWFMNVDGAGGWQESHAYKMAERGLDNTSWCTPMIGALAICGSLGLKPEGGLGRQIGQVMAEANNWRPNAPVN